MTSTEGSTRTEVSHVVTWGPDTTIVLMSDGQAHHARPASVWTSRADQGCTSDRTSDVDDIPCEDYSCEVCWRAWGPGWEFPHQGTVAGWHLGQVNALHREIEDLKRQIEQDYILISTVQNVAHDYSVQQEWCGVYEEAFTHLRTPFWPNGIPVLEVEDDVIVTVQLAMRVRASRRQRQGDEDYMQRSLDMWRIRNAIQGLDPFDESYSVVSDEVRIHDVSIELDN